MQVDFGRNLIPETLLLPPETSQVVAEGPNSDIQSFFEQNKK